MVERRRYALLLPVALLIANLFNMAGIVALPKIVDPEQFALFSIASSVGLFLISIIYEWNRVSIIRYSVAVEAAETGRRRSVLLRSNSVTSFTLLAVAVWCFAFRDNYYASIVSMACLFAVSQALFEARQAIFRADYQDKSYSVSLVMRSAVGFSFLCIGAYLTNSAHFAMAAWAASFALVLILTMRRVDSFLRSEPFDWGTFWFLLRFGIGITLASIAAAVLSPAIRILASEYVPLADSGKLMLVLDISQKLIGVIGVSINILTLQATIRASEFGREVVVRQRIGMQLSIVLSIIVPSVAGVIIVREEFTTIFVPVAYRDVFLLNIGWCMVSAGVIGFRAFALDNIFIVLGRPYIGIWGPVSTAVVSIFAALLFLREHEVSVLAFSQAMCVGAAFGAALSLVVARRLCKFPLEWANLTKVVLASVVMAVSVYMLDFESSIVDLLCSMLVGCFVYFVILYVTNAFSLWNIVKKLAR